jgi:hypothetical protein
MKSIFRYIAGTLGIAFAVWAYGIYTMPERKVAERNEIYLQQAGGYNAFVHQKLSDASWREFVKPCPDLLYSYLVFDTRNSAIAVEIPGYNDYWVNQMVDDQTDSFAYVGQRTAGSEDVKFILYSDDTPPFKTPDGFRSYKSPSSTGTFLLRYLVRSPDAVTELDTLRKKINVTPIGKRT